MPNLPVQLILPSTRALCGGVIFDREAVGRNLRGSTWTRGRLMGRHRPTRRNRPSTGSRCLQSGRRSLNFLPLALGARGISPLHSDTLLGVLLEALLPVFPRSRFRRPFGLVVNLAGQFVQRFMLLVDCGVRGVHLGLQVIKILLLLDLASDTTVEFKDLQFVLVENRLETPDGILDRAAISFGCV
jgi:hypothetical protein